MLLTFKTTKHLSKVSIYDNKIEKVEISLVEKFITDWAMYDEIGNLAVASMMYELKRAMKFKPLPQVRRQLHESIKEIGKQHGEVYDSEVRDNILFFLSQWACKIHELDPVFGLNSNYWDL